MNAEQRRRAGEALRLRRRELHVSVPKVAEKAGLSVGTIHALERGERWPNADTQRRIEDAVGWLGGELARRGVGSRPTDTVSEMPTHELLDLLAACCAEIKSRLRFAAVTQDGLGPIS